MSDERSRALSEAALRLFTRHGFQRTSMADVAREAGIARATLYLRFRDKRALFAWLAQGVADDALACAAAAWEEGRGLAANVAATLLAKDLPLYRLLHASPHGAELLAVDAELTREHAERLDAGFAAILAGRVSVFAAANLTPFGDSAGFGLFLATAGAGLKHEARSEHAYRAAVERLAAVTAAAAGLA